MVVTRILRSIRSTKGVWTKFSHKFESRFAKCIVKCIESDPAGVGGRVGMESIAVRLFTCPKVIWKELEYKSRIHYIVAGSR